MRAQLYRLPDVSWEISLLRTSVLSHALWFYSFSGEEGRGDVRSWNIEKFVNAPSCSYGLDGGIYQLPQPLVLCPLLVFFGPGSCVEASTDDVGRRKFCQFVPFCKSQFVEILECKMSSVFGEI